jgi:hypothetical protein
MASSSTNLRPLAWILAFSPFPAIEAAQIPRNVSRAIVFDFVGTDNSVHQLLQNPGRRKGEQVIVMEDWFYCAHNAAQSAPTGEDAVTARFDPISHGGVVQKQRHSLTWCLAPHQLG